MNEFNNSYTNQGTHDSNSTRKTISDNMNEYTAAVDIFDNCDSQNTGLVHVSKLIEFILPFTVQFPDELETLKKYLDPEQKDPQIDKKFFCDAISNWTSVISGVVNYTETEMDSVAPDVPETVTNLQEQMEVLQRRNNKLLQDLNSATTDLFATEDRFQTEIQNLKEELHVNKIINMNFATLRTEVLELREFKHSANEQIELLKKELADLEYENKKNCSQKQKIEDEFENVRRKEKEQQKMLIDAQEEIHLLKAEIMELYTKLVQCEQTVEIKSKTIEALTNETQSLRHQLEEIQKCQKEAYVERKRSHWKSSVQQIISNINQGKASQTLKYNSSNLKTENYVPVKDRIKKFEVSSKNETFDKNCVINDNVSVEDNYTNDDYFYKNDEFKENSLMAELIQAEAFKTDQLNVLYSSQNKNTTDFVDKNIDFINHLKNNEKTDVVHEELQWESLQVGEDDDLKNETNNLKIHIYNLRLQLNSVTMAALTKLGSHMGYPDIFMKSYQENMGFINNEISSNLEEEVEKCRQQIEACEKLFNLLIELAVIAVQDKKGAHEDQNNIALNPASTRNDKSPLTSSKHPNELDMETRRKKKKISSQSISETDDIKIEKNKQFPDLKDSVNVSTHGSENLNMDTLTEFISPTQITNSCVTSVNSKFDVTLDKVSINEDSSVLKKTFNDNITNFDADKHSILISNDCTKAEAGTDDDITQIESPINDNQNRNFCNITENRQRLDIINTETTTESDYQQLRNDNEVNELNNNFATTTHIENHSKQIPADEPVIQTTENSKQFSTIGTENLSEQLDVNNAELLRNEESVLKSETNQPISKTFQQIGMKPITIKRRGSVDSMSGNIKIGNSLLADKICKENDKSDKNIETVLVKEDCALNTSEEILIPSEIENRRKTSAILENIPQRRESNISIASSTNSDSTESLSIDSEHYYLREELRSNIRSALIAAALKNNSGQPTDSYPPSSEKPPNIRSRAQSVSEDYVSKSEESEEVDIFPSLPDSILGDLDLLGEGPRERLEQQEIENKFSALSLAFTIDGATLEQRRERLRRYRDQAENNLASEIARLVSGIHRFYPFCIDAERTQLVSSLLAQIEVLLLASSRISSSAQSFGAVEQECRIAQSVNLMLNHVENLKQQRDTAKRQLQCTKRMLQDTTTPESVKAASSRQRTPSTPSVSSGNSRMLTQRRASIATILRPGSASPDHQPKVTFSRRLSPSPTEMASARRPSELPDRLSSGSLRSARASRSELNVELLDITENKEAEFSDEVCFENNSDNDRLLAENDQDNTPSITHRAAHRVCNLFRKVLGDEFVKEGTLHEVCYAGIIVCFTCATIMLANVLLEVEIFTKGSAEQSPILCSWNFWNDFRQSITSIYKSTQQKV